jgi:hypothetical protein
MVLGGRTVLIPSRHHGRFNEGESCEQGDFCYPQSNHIPLEEFPIVVEKLRYSWCCHKGCDEPVTVVFSRYETVVVNRSTATSDAA